MEDNGTGEGRKNEGESKTEGKGKKKGESIATKIIKKGRGAEEET